MENKMLIFQLLQMSFFGLAAVNDLQPGKKSESSLNRCKDLLFAVFVFPVGMVRSIFWKTRFLSLNIHYALNQLCSLHFI